MKKFLANGSEELEAVGIINLLRRAGGEVTVASISKQKEVKCSRGVHIVADKLLSDCVSEEYDAIVLPGGMPGAEHLRDDANLTYLLKKQKQDGKWIAAICASPAVVLHHHNLLEGSTATCYPAFMDKLKDKSDQDVVVSNKIITSKGPGTVFMFTLAIIKNIIDEETAKKVADGILV